MYAAAVLSELQIATSFQLETQLTSGGTAQYIGSAVGRDRTFRPFLFFIVCMANAAA